MLPCSGATGYIKKKCKPKGGHGPIAHPTVCHWSLLGINDCKKSSDKGCLLSACNLSYLTPQTIDRNSLRTLLSPNTKTDFSASLNVSGVHGNDIALVDMFRGQ